jgi:hypothetical protein
MEKWWNTNGTEPPKLPNKTLDEVLLHSRLEESVKVLKGLKSMGIRKEICPELEDFSKVLSTWIKTGNTVNGSIDLPEINKKIVYQLARPNDNTVVKLTKLT